MYWEHNGIADLLYPGQKESFSVAKTPEIKFVFGTMSNRGVSVHEYWPDNERLLVKYTPDSSPGGKQLQLYTGVYYCPELDCNYGIILKDHDLLLTNNKYNDTKITLAGKDDFFTDFWWIHHVKMINDSTNKIIGFEVNEGRVMHLRFNKIQ